MERIEIVSTEPLRERYLKLEKEGRMSARLVAVRLHEAGFPGFARKVSPSMAKNYHQAAYDTTRVKRMLGIKLTPSGKFRGDGTRYPHKLTEYINYDYAVVLADLFGMAPVDAGV